MKSKASVIGEDETIEQLNEKARLHGLSYGKYIQARYAGKYLDEILLQIPITHLHRQAWCKKSKARKFD